MRRAFAFLLMFVMAACSRGAPVTVNASGEPPYHPSHDYFTFSNYGDFKTCHLALDLGVDFDQRILAGSATLFVNLLEPDTRELVLDTRDLTIREVRVGVDPAEYMPAGFELGRRDERLGQPLTIQLPESFRPEGEFQIRIDYRTDPGSTALQWLPPALTSGGEHPMLFSQSQNIHARSWIPLQDTPSMRITYEATIRTPPSLIALMSAANDPAAERNGEYRFDMPQPIPSYLMALAVGNFQFAEIGEDTGIYAEPELLDAAAWEFSETQRMMDRTEAVYGPYQWGRYDLLILPPSFPYGGMENPRLSFITSTVLAGDRSLVSLIAHELAHSWAGNLVSNATWRDIWLNEGVTSYLDLRLVEMLYGKARADEERYISYTNLLRQFSDVAADKQALAPNLRGSDGEESQGSTYYTKGQLMLDRLERAFGRKVFDEFLAGYFKRFAWQSITTEQFVDYIERELFQAFPGRYSVAQLQEWLYQPGLPRDAWVSKSTSIEQSTQAALAFAAGEIGADDIPVDGWSPQMVVNLLAQLPPETTSSQLSKLDQALGLSASRNAEIAREWFTQVARRRHEPAYPALATHLEHFGRIWLIEGVYAGLIGNGKDRELAREIFERARAGYHPLTRLRIQERFE